MALAKSFCSGGMRMLPEKPHSPSTELISGDGEFNEAGFKNFLKSVKLHEHGSVVVAIIGQQSSGKSTLMNHLFGTDFKEMKPRQPRGATTKGIWTAKSLEMERLIIAVDLEGTDSRERGQDDKTFERQSGLFAAIIADVLIINMNCQNIGLDEGGNRPLLKVIFEAMMRLFGPRKTTLLFVLRNKTEVEIPFHMLESDLREDIEKIWETALKLPGHENTRLGQIFNVEVAALSSYKSAPNIFAEEVARLRSRLFDSISPRRRHNVETGSEVISFASAKSTWEIIKGCKDLDLPSHKVMVATVRCEEIAMEKLCLFASDKDWLLLQEAAASSLVSGFSTRTSSILDKYLSEYDDDSMQFEKDVSKAKRKYLMSEASKVVRPAYTYTLGHRRSDALRSFESRLKVALSEGGGFAESVRTCQHSCVLQFDEQCGSDDEIFSKGDVLTVRHQLLRDIENHWHLVRADKLPQIAEQQRERLSTKFSRQIRYFLTNCGDRDIWGCIRSLVRSESDAAALALSSAVVEYKLDRATTEQMVEELKQSATKLVVTKFKEETQDVQLLLKQRFIDALAQFEPSDQEGNEPTKENVYRQCVKLLSTVAVIRLDEREGDIISLDDDVESVLLSALMPAADRILPDPHPLASHTWEQVPPEMTLITPAQCREIWGPFKLEMEQHHDSAKRVQKKCEETGHWRPPTWVTMGLLALEFSSFMFLTRVCQLDVKLALKFVEFGKDKLSGVMGVDIAAEGIDTAKFITGLSEKVDNIDFKGFRKRYSNIMKGVERFLRMIYKIITSFTKNNEVVVVSA